MAKYYGSALKSGKVGGSVYRVRAGQTIEAQYNPVVRNPNSPRQQAQRARFKLVNEMAALFSPYSMLMRGGMESPTNAFCRANFANSSYDEEKGIASYALEKTRLTDSTLILGRISSYRGNSVVNTSVEFIPAYVEAVRILIILPLRESMKPAVFDTGLHTVKHTEGVPNGGSVEDSLNLNEYAVPIAPGFGATLAYGILDVDKVRKIQYGNSYWPTESTIEAKSAAAALDSTRVSSQLAALLTETIGMVQLVPEE